MSHAFDIEKRLGMDRMRVDPFKAARLWRWADVKIEAELPNGFSADLSLTQRIRGAFGQVLMREKVFSRDADTLFELMFDEQPDWARSHPELPKPFTLRAWQGTGRIYVQLRLFGFVRFLARSAAGFLTQALAVGIAIAERSSVRVPLHSRSSVIDDREGVPPYPSSIGWAACIFRTPVAVLQNNKMFVTSDRLCRSWSNRVLQHAVWQDLLLDEHTLGTAFDGFDWRMVERSSQKFSGDSGRQHRSNIRFTGDLVTLVGQGRSEVLAPILKIGEVTAIGARTAFGFGACRVFIL